MFITGSHAYGTPTPSSDIDIVVLAEDMEVINFIVEHSELTHYPIRYGNLNIITTISYPSYVLWKQCTKDLILLKKNKTPVDSEKARDYIQSKFEAAGLERFMNPSGRGKK